MKTNLLSIALLSLIVVFQSCSKDDPIPETDQEEVGGATLYFTEVEAEAHGDHMHYHEIEAAETDSIVFSGSNYLPPVGAHLHLVQGKTYHFHLKTVDFANRESQQTFIDRADQHYVFLGNIPEGSLDVVYQDVDSKGEKVEVGVNGYITVLKTAPSFNFRYIMRHLNPGVKASINTTTDMFNPNVTSFAGANDLDLQFEVHLVESDHEDGHEDHEHLEHQH